MTPDFSSADAILAHLDAYIGSITDQYITSRYTGFVAVIAVTSFETNVRAKIFDFCLRKNKTFGYFAEMHFEKTNAKIKLEHLRDEYLKKFGLRYLNRFKKRTEKLELEYLRSHGVSLKGSYNNLIKWRHDFVHDGTLPAFATYGDARSAYDSGKLIVQAFFESLER